MPAGLIVLIQLIGQLMPLIMKYVTAKETDYAAIDAEVKSAFDDYNLAIGGLQGTLAADDAAADKAIDDAFKAEEPPKTP